MNFLELFSHQNLRCACHKIRKALPYNGSALQKMQLAAIPRNMEIEKEAYV